MKGKP
ncbi:hypothetical protein YPPY113_1946, partial [Yersinia pestis PY-113]